MFDISKILRFLKKNFGLKDAVLIIFILIAFFATRLVNLESLPIFGDEGIYIRWAKTAWKDANWRFISLTDGRQPLQTWLTIPFLKLFPEKPLFAGRLFGVFSGFLALAGVFTTLFYLFNKKIAYIGALLYIFTPYFMFYDRMALADSMVNAGFIWLFFLSTLLWKSLSLDVSLIFGLAGGFFLLAKSSLRLAFINSIFAPLISLFPIKKVKVKKFVQHSVNYYFLLAIAGFLALIIYNVQRLSPFFHFVSQKNLTFVMSFSEFKQNPFAYFPRNIKLIPYYLFSETTWIFALFVILGFFKLFKKDKGLALYLLTWIFIPSLAIAFFAKVLFPRYLLFLGGLLIVPASYYLYQVLTTSYQLPIIRNPKFEYRNPKQILNSKFEILNIIIVCVFVYQVFAFDKAILFSPKDIPFPPVDRGQYIEGITAGWGIKEILEYAREKSQQKEIILLTEGDFGVLGDQFEALKTSKHKKVSIKGLWPVSKKDLLKYAKEKDKFVFLVLTHTKNPPPDWPIKLIKKYEKPGGKEAIYLYKVIND